LACHFKGDLCIPVPFYFYLLSDESQKIKDYVTTLWAASTMIAFVGIVLGCQAVIETK
jgi:hypothetical protein